MDLYGYVAVLRRRWLVLLLCLVAGVAGGWYSGHHGPKTYQAHSRVLVDIPPAAQITDALAGVQLSSSFIETYANLASSRAVATRVVDRLGLTLPVPAVQRMVVAQPEEKTFIIDLSVKDTDPKRAASVADEVAVALRDEVAQLQGSRNDKISIQLLDQAVVPSVPISPKPRSDLLIGLVLGAVAGILLMAAFESLDRRIRTPGQADAQLGAPLLAVVSRQREGVRALVAADERDPLGEPYRTLRTAIRYLDPDSPVRSLVVTSAAAGEGKTTVTANLAVALASSGTRVAVVDADLRRAQLGQAFGLETAVGFTSVVTRQATLSSALQEWRPNLLVLPSGPLPPNPSEILGSESAAAILAELGSMVDVVVIDAPPVLPVTDAVVLGTQVDGILMVVRHAQSNRVAVASARRQLNTVGVRILGYVYNAMTAGTPNYSYNYYRYELKGEQSAVQQDAESGPQPSPAA